MLLITAYEDVECREFKVNTLMSYKNILDKRFFCGGGTYSNNGARDCKEILLRKALMKTGKCGRCTPGYEYIVDDHQCRNCYSGFFQQNENVSDCITCSDAERSLPERLAA